MDPSFSDFWSAGIDVSLRRESRLAAAIAAASAVNIRKFSTVALRDLAADRGVPLHAISHDTATLVPLIEQHTARVRGSPAAKAQLGGWLGGHASFRNYGAELELQASRLLAAFVGVESDNTSGAPSLSSASAGALVRRLGAGVKKLADAVYSHGSWEEEAIFGFLKKELRSFAPFHDALTSEHHGAADLASEVRKLCPSNFTVPIRYALCLLLHVD
jgi:hypothetical protein